MNHSVRTIASLDELEAERSRWERLAARVARPSVFLTHAWFEAAWAWRGRTGTLDLLICERDGDLLGVLPLVAGADGADGSAVRALEFLTVPDTQFCDVIAARDCEEEVVDVFVGALAARRQRWDVIRLRYLPRGSLTQSRLLPAIARRGFPTHVAEASPNPFVALEGTWDAFHSTRSRSLKKANNLAANRLRKAGEIRIEWLAPGEGDVERVDRVVRDIIDVSARSWKTRTGNSLDNAGPQAFIRKLSRVAHARGWLSVWTLALDGRPLAMEYQLVADGNAYALRSDFDAGRDDISPGSHLSRHLLERLFGRGLVRYYMGPGENAYKYRWTEHAESTYEASIYSSTLRGRLLATWELTLKPLARRVRERLRKAGPLRGRTEKGDPSQ